MQDDKYKPIVAPRCFFAEVDSVLSWIANRHAVALPDDLVKECQHVGMKARSYHECKPTVWEIIGSAPDWFKKAYRNSPILNRAFQDAAESGLSEVETLWFALKIIHDCSEGWMCAATELQKRTVAVPADWLLAKLENPDEKLNLTASGWSVDELFLAAKSAQEHTKNNAESQPAS